MKRGILSFILIVALGHLCAQERPSLEDIRCDFFTTDIQGNLFLWKDNSLSLYSIEGKYLADYKDWKSGNISNVSAQIGSKILVFHQEAGIIHLLNNKLAPIENPINLFDKGWYTISKASLLDPDRIVLYDQANQDLIITDLNLNIENKTHCDFGIDFAPQQLKINTEKSILLIDSINGIYIFDSFGTYEKKIPITGVEDAQLYQGTIYFLKQGKIFSYQLTNMDYLEWKSPILSIKSFTHSFNYNYFLDESGKIHIEKITHN